MQHEVPGGGGSKSEGNHSPFNLAGIPDFISASFQPNRVGNQFDRMLTALRARERALGFTPIGWREEEVQDVTQSVCNIIENELRPDSSSPTPGTEVFVRATYLHSNGALDVCVDIQDKRFFSILPVEYTCTDGGTPLVISRELLRHPMLVLIETDLQLSAFKTKPLLSDDAFGECLDHVASVGQFLRTRGDRRIVLSDIPEPSWVMSSAVFEILRRQSPEEIEYSHEGIWIPDIRAADLTPTKGGAVLHLEVEMELWENRIHGNVSSRTYLDRYDFTISRDRYNLATVTMNPRVAG